MDRAVLPLPLCSSTNRADCTNMPPDPQAGSYTRPENGSMMSTINLTIDVGGKNSPPRGPPVDVVGDRPDQTQQLDEPRFLERAVVAWQHTFEVGVVLFDRRHGIVHG